jgi:hypothetical protein
MPTSSFYRFKRVSHGVLLQYARVHLASKKEGGTFGFFRF